MPSNMSVLKTEVEAAGTGLLDRATALETADANIKASMVATVPVSFETGFQGTYTFYFPKACTVTKIRGFANKALAATDAGTITAKNNAGTDMANGVLTFAASAAFGNEQTANPTTNNTFTAGQKIQFAVAKTTPGGEALVFIEYTLT